MSTPVVPPPRRRIWPLAAMSLLIGLLATFLVVKVTRPADESAEFVKPAPPPVPKSAPVPPPVDPADKLLEEAETAFRSGRWDEAATKAEQAKPTRAVAAAALLSRIEEARKGKTAAEAAQLAEDQRKREEEAAAIEKARRDRDDALAALTVMVTDANAHVAASRWDAALKVYEDGVAKYPVLAGVADYQSERRKVEQLRRDSAESFATAVRKANSEAKAGQYITAINTARVAVSIYPENPAGPALRWPRTIAFHRLPRNRKARASASADGTHSSAAGGRLRVFVVTLAIVP